MDALENLTENEQTQEALDQAKSFLDKFGDTLMAIFRYFIFFLNL